MEGNDSNVKGVKFDKVKIGQVPLLVFAVAKGWYKLASFLVNVIGVNPNIYNDKNQKTLFDYIPPHKGEDLRQHIKNAIEKRIIKKKINSASKKKRQSNQEIDKQISKVIFQNLLDPQRKEMLNNIKLDEMPLLHYMLSKGYNNSAKYLINNRINLKAKDNIWNTSLHIAAGVSNIEAAALLLHNGSDPNTADQFNVTPLHIASYTGNIKMVKLLLKNKANPNNPDFFNTTPLHIATMIENYDMMEMLIQNGAHIDMQFSPSGLTPLQIAAIVGNHDMLKLLIQNGAHINMQTSLSELTPLHIASQCDDYTTVKLLIEKRANINMKSAGKNLTTYSCRKRLRPNWRLS